MPGSALWQLVWISTTTNLPVPLYLPLYLNCLFSVAFGPSTDYSASYYLLLLLVYSSLLLLLTFIEPLVVDSDD